ncbi:uncharacterized protein MONOS_15832 [Monocercomonoides exilis]|uniref:uncharacterized protein n=1 Tax=Monocercomonoides exilis TaxID=2049356 RepID=UPI00355AB94B|nr:hypothetical protein MONOS_15832 [Monocercomonoides exilis]|eukprot:MONOS_15832.1-p1 / transcript=MONOS_15832.1 / gene=MONOS_15832 / organism=Monocercomonoides_exilis_PA203 / gene_product=unspecified product / transcript_product=unspecified product / location=Mono_scaffold01371:4201-4506(-) / protein_length=102 / sequence_SO=supercontig / SO=protein_coding / is_pseudo=false
MSLAGEENCCGGEDNRRGANSGIRERSEKNDAGVNGGSIDDTGGSCEGGVNTTLWKKINEMEKETKMLMELSKIYEQMTIEKKALFNNVIEKLKTGLVQSE